MKNCIITSSGLSWVSIEKGIHFDVPKSHVNYDEIEKMLMDDYPDDEIIEKIKDKKANLSDFSSNSVIFEDGKYYFNGNEIDNSIVKRINELRSKGYKFEFMEKFLINLYNNTSMQTRESLYDFLENKGLPITEDGCFVAYKAVRHDYLDIYSSQFDNHPGTIVKMNRSLVDDDRDRGCSYGFHAGSMDYVKGYCPSDGRILMVKIKPENVVSVPYDCECQKIRVCEYEVIKEMTIELEDKTIDHSYVNIVEEPVVDKNLANIECDERTDFKRGSKWQDWEDEYLKKHINDYTYDQIGEAIHRSGEAVRKRAVRLGIWKKC